MSDIESAPPISAEDAMRMTLLIVERMNATMQAMAASVEKIAAALISDDDTEEDAKDAMDRN